MFHIGQKQRKEHPRTQTPFLKGLSVKTLMFSSNPSEFKQIRLHYCLNAVKVYIIKDKQNCFLKLGANEWKVHVSLPGVPHYCKIDQLSVVKLFYFTFTLLSSSRSDFLNALASLEVTFLNEWVSHSFSLVIRDCSHFMSVKVVCL